MKTIQIGDQTWMAENLKTSKYTDGTPIPNVTDINEWNSLSVFFPENGGSVVNFGAFCWYNDDSITYEKEYGRLYNFGTIETGKLCPAGWHVPTIEEWKVLYNPCGIGGNDEEHLGGLNILESGTTHWNMALGTNETGFTALPGSGAWDYGGQNLVRYWTSDQFDGGYFMGIYYELPDNGENGHSPLSMGAGYESGFYVRCVKNK